MMAPEPWEGRLDAPPSERPIIGGRARKASGEVGDARGLALSVGLALMLAACHRGGADWREAQANPASGEVESGYVKPPQVLTASRQTDGSILLSGRSKPSVRIRLSSPDGNAYGTTAGQDGTWSALAPPSGAVRMFGLSEEINGRLVQGEGYIVLLPAPGRAGALLRAGGGAAALDGEGPVLEIDAVDFDAGGATVISGAARTGQPLKLTVDQAPAAESRPDSKGRFAIGLAAMLRPGDHTLTIEQAGAQASARIHLSPPQPIAGSPYRGVREANDWRVDWTTPGGGVQTALIVDRPGSPSEPTQ